jgi:flavin reductase (DIM6/NTAB) family NADH-FMN oxidoreductase RutF
MADFSMGELTPPERYHLMTRAVGPRPIAFVSSLSAEGRGNLAPFSYFNIGGGNPPSAIICPVRDRKANRKDTLINIEETGEYVINVVTLDMAERMNQASWAYPRGIDEFDKAGFTRAPSAVVKPPRVAESPINLEMKLFQIVRHGESALSSNYVIGEIVHMHIDDDVMTNELPDNTKIGHIGRLGGDYYCRVDGDSIFIMPRPSSPESSSRMAG